MQQASRPVSPAEDQGAASSISDGDMRKFIDLIYQRSGIVLAVDKKSMITSRLYKRVKALELVSFRAYMEYLQSAPARDAEIATMIGEITTNKTAFYRESHHFDYLTGTLLPSFAKSGRPAINVWSAGCSTGEEPYTLAMVMAEFFGTLSRFNIFAGDLSSRTLQVAQQAVYANELGASIPAALRQKYTLTGRGAQHGRFRIVPELVERVNFFNFNLIDRVWNIPKGMDLIFCRNVMIYFDKKTRDAITVRFGQTIRNGGHLFIGHSEALSNSCEGFAQVRPTIYVHEKAATT